MTVMTVKKLKEILNELPEEAIIEGLFASQDTYSMTACFQDLEAPNLSEWKEMWGPESENPELDMLSIAGFEIMDCRHNKHMQANGTANVYVRFGEEN